MKIILSSIVIFIIVSIMQASEYSLVQTPSKYYDYKNLHSEYRLKNWQDKKQFIIKSIQKIHKKPELIKAIVNKPEWGETGHTPLSWAIEMNDCAFTQFLLDHGAEVNITLQGLHSSKPIFFASSLEMVQLLHNNGADIRVYNEGPGITRRMNLLHALLHTGKSDDRLVIYLLFLGFDLRDTTISENLDNFRFLRAQSWDPISRGCCQNKLSACIKRACSDLSFYASIASNQ